MKKFVIAFITFAFFPGMGFGANSKKYCDSIADLATQYVGDRDYGWSYGKTLATADAALDQADLSPTERMKFRRDIHASIKLVYIDFPKITSQGIYKLVYIGCESEK